MEPNPPPPSESSSTDQRRDQKDLKRGVVVNLIGYALKIGHPALFIAVIHLYGAELFGIYTAVSASVLLLFRFCLFGLHKTVLWWVPQQKREDARDGIQPALFVSLFACTALIVFANAVGTEAMARFMGAGASAPGLSWMVYSLPALACAEIFSHALMGRRRTEVQAIVRDALAPGLHAGLSLALFYTAFRREGLFLAYFSSQLVAAVISFVVFQRHFAGSPWPAWRWFPPRKMMRYSLPMWGSEFAYSALQRMDIYVLAQLTNPTTVGIYGAVTQVTNVLRSIRQSFDPLVLAITTEATASKDTNRIVAGMSKATIGVIFLQGPVCAAMVALAPFIMGIFGAGFEVGESTLVAVALLGCVTGTVGLQPHILGARGRSDIQLASVLGALALQAMLLAVLIPPLDLLGAGLAVAITSLVQTASLAWLSRRALGTRALDARAEKYSRVQLVALALLLGSWIAMRPFDAWLRATVTFALFAVFFFAARFILEKSSAPATSSQ